MTSLPKKISDELKELIPVTLFFFITFQLLALTQSLLLEKYGVETSTFAAATIMALLVAKVVIIADHFSLINRFPTRPLIYNVAWKTFIYFCASCLLRYLEHLLRFWRETGSFSGAQLRLVQEVVWPHLLCVQIWLLVLLFVYCALRELVRALGRERIIKIFFHQISEQDQENLKKLL